MTPAKRPHSPDEDSSLPPSKRPKPNPLDCSVLTSTTSRTAKLSQKEKVKLFRDAITSAQHKWTPERSEMANLLLDKIESTPGHASHLPESIPLRKTSALYKDLISCYEKRYNVGEACEHLFGHVEATYVLHLLLVLLDFRPSPDDEAADSDDEAVDSDDTARSTRSDDSSPPQEISRFTKMTRGSPWKWPFRTINYSDHFRHWTNFFQSSQTRKWNAARVKKGKELLRQIKENKRHSSLPALPLPDTIKTQINNELKKDKPANGTNFSKEVFNSDRLVLNLALVFFNILPEKDWEWPSDVMDTRQANVNKLKYWENYVAQQKSEWDPNRARLAETALAKISQRNRPARLPASKQEYDQKYHDELKQAFDAGKNATQSASQVFGPSSIGPYSLLFQAVNNWKWNGAYKWPSKRKGGVSKNRGVWENIIDNIADVEQKTEALKRLERVKSGNKLGTLPNHLWATDSKQYQTLKDLYENNGTKTQASQDLFKSNGGQTCIDLLICIYNIGQKNGWKWSDSRFKPVPVAEERFQYWEKQWQLRVSEAAEKSPKWWTDARYNDGMEYLENVCRGGDYDTSHQLPESVQVMEEKKPILLQAVREQWSPNRAGRNMEMGYLDRDTLQFMMLYLDIVSISLNNSDGDYMEDEQQRDSPSSLPSATFEQQHDSPFSLPNAISEQQRDSPSSLPNATFEQQHDSPSPLPNATIDQQRDSPSSLPNATVDQQRDSPSSLPNATIDQQLSPPHNVEYSRAFFIWPSAIPRITRRDRAMELKKKLQPEMGKWTSPNRIRAVNDAIDTIIKRSLFVPEKLPSAQVVQYAIDQNMTVRDACLHCYNFQCGIFIHKAYLKLVLAIHLLEHPNAENGTFEWCYQADKSKQQLAYEWWIKAIKSQEFSPSHIELMYAELDRLYKLHLVSQLPLWNAEEMPEKQQILQKCYVDGVSLSEAGRRLGSVSTYCLRFLMMFFHVASNTEYNWKKRLEKEEALYLDKISEMENPALRMYLRLTVARLAHYGTKRLLEYEWDEVSLSYLKTLSHFCGPKECAKELFSSIFAHRKNAHIWQKGAELYVFMAFHVHVSHGEYPWPFMTPKIADILLPSSLVVERTSTDDWFVADEELDDNEGTSHDASSSESSQSRVNMLRPLINLTLRSLQIPQFNFDKTEWDQEIFDMNVDLTRRDANNASSEYVLRFHVTTLNHLLAIIVMPVKSRVCSLHQINFDNIPEEYLEELITLGKKYSENREQFVPIKRLIEQGRGILKLWKSAQGHPLSVSYWERLFYDKDSAQRIAERFVLVHGFQSATPKHYRWNDDTFTVHRGYEPIACFILEQHYGVKSTQVTGDLDKGHGMATSLSSGGTYTPDLTLHRNGVVDVIEIKSCYTLFVEFAKNRQKYAAMANSGRRFRVVVLHPYKGTVSCLLELFFDEDGVGTVLCHEPSAMERHARGHDQEEAYKEWISEFSNDSDAGDVALFNHTVAVKDVQDRVKYVKVDIFALWEKYGEKVWKFEPNHFARLALKLHREQEAEEEEA